MPRTVAGGVDGRGARAYPYLIAVSFPLGLWLGNLGEEPTEFDVVGSFVLTLTLAAVADRLLRRCLRRQLAGSFQCLQIARPVLLEMHLDIQRDLRVSHHHLDGNWVCLQCLQCFQVPEVFISGCDIDRHALHE